MRFLAEFSGTIVAESQEEADKLAARIATDAEGFNRLPHGGIDGCLATMSVEVVIPKPRKAAAA